MGTNFHLVCRQAIAGAILVMSTALAAPGWAQGWPSEHPIRIVVPFPPGGSTDLLARKIGEKMAKSLGQTVLVDNRQGATGTIGAAHVPKSKPDGYTLLLGVISSNAVAGVLNPRLGYDSVKDFSFISSVVSAPVVLVVSTASVPAKTLPELIAYAKTKPGEVSYATLVPGFTYLVSEAFAQRAGVKLLHVPYHGNGPAMNDLLGGQVDMQFGDVLVSEPHVKAGKLRALAVTSAKRSTFLPDVPTVAELGFPELTGMVAWQGFFAPPGTPESIVNRLNAEVNKALSDSELQQYFESRGFVVEGSTPAGFKQFVADEVKRWTAGASTGREIANLVAGRPTLINLEPFSPRRFHS